MIGRVLKQGLNSTLRCDCGKLFQRQSILSPVIAIHPKSASFSSSKFLGEGEDSIVKKEQDFGFAERFQSSKATETQIVEDEKVLKGDAGTSQDDSHGYFDMGILIPTLDTFDVLFDGVPYRELPIAYIQCTKNNTIISITNHQRTKHLAHMSGGLAGFKNAGKSTSVAGQTAGYSIGQIVRQQGVKNLRVVLNGFGQGRYSAVHGMKLAGMNIVSLTDQSVDHQTFRPRKVRRV